MPCFASRNLLENLLRLFAVLLVGGTAACGPIQLDFSPADVDAADVAPFDNPFDASDADVPPWDSGDADASCPAPICDPDAGDAALDSTFGFDAAIDSPLDAPVDTSADATPEDAAQMPDGSDG